MSEAPGRCDTVIRNGVLVDGTGAPPRAADVAISGDRIAAVGDLGGVAAEREIDAGGRAVAPGFIDAHTHDDRALLSDPDMAFKASQGVTTVVIGNCGSSLAPLAPGRPTPPPLNLFGGPEWWRFPTVESYVAELERAPAAINAAVLVGHATLRTGVMDDLGRPAADSEIAAMQGQLEEGMAAGAIGFSTGLFYPPNRAAPTDEVVALAEVAARAGGIYTTHMRDEHDHVLDSLDETFEIGARARLPVVVSHHKCAGPRNFGRTRETLRSIDGARRNQEVGLDVYPYTAGSSVLLPALIEDSARVLITWSEPCPEAAGRELDALAAEWSVDRFSAADRLQPAGAVYFMMDEEDRAPGPRLPPLDDRLGREPARREAPSAPLGHLSPGARTLLARRRPLPAGDRGSQDDGPPRLALRFRGSRGGAPGRGGRHRHLRSRRGHRPCDLRGPDPAGGGHPPRDGERRDGLGRSAFDRGPPGTRAAPRPTGPSRALSRYGLTPGRPARGAGGGRVSVPASRNPAPGFAPTSRSSSADARPR